MISIIFENRISFSKIGIKKLRKKNILSSRDINANIISRNFTEYSIYSPVRISHAKDARINNFSTLLFYLKIIFYFTILKILARSNRFECRFARRSTLPSITHTHTHTDEIRWHPQISRSICLCASLNASLLFTHVAPPFTANIVKHKQAGYKQAIYTRSFFSCYFQRDRFKFISLWPSCLPLGCLIVHSLGVRSRSKTRVAFVKTDIIKHN